VYALGVVAYQCLTLTPPFVADTPVAVALMHTRDEPPPLPAGVPEPVQQVVMVALAKDPRDRWPSAAAMGEAAVAAVAAANGATTVPPIPVSPGRRAGPGPRTSTSLPSGAMRTGALRTNEPSTNTGQLRIQGQARPPARSRQAPRGRLAWAAALAGLLLLACVGWVAFVRDPGGGAEAAPPPSTTTTTSTSAITSQPSPTAGPTATTSPTPPPRTTTTPPRPTSPSPTAKRTPGPGEIYVPDVTGQYPDSAWYNLYSAGLNPEIVTMTVPDKCSVKETQPAKGEIIKVGAAIKIIAEMDNPGCQPV
jgi:eukaryotic-like serine/threonine-protein kinase